MAKDRLSRLTCRLASGSLDGEMIRYAAALSVLVLTACAQPQPMDPRAQEAALVYQNLQLESVEHQMIFHDKELTYGFAVVNCGLRDQQWMNMLQAVYATDFTTEIQIHRLTPDQQAQAKAYAQAHVSSPVPPPYICELLSTDKALPELDTAVASESLVIASAKKQAS